MPSRRVVRGCSDVLLSGMNLPAQALAAADVVVERLDDLVTNAFQRLVAAGE